MAWMGGGGGAVIVHTGVRGDHSNVSVFSVHMYALRIVSTDMILRITNTLIIMIIITYGWCLVNT